MLYMLDPRRGFILLETSIAPWWALVPTVSFWIVLGNKQVAHYTKPPVDYSLLDTPVD
jgi:hypothetical protein